MARGQRVDGAPADLGLRGNQLTGPIAAELGDLSKLRILDLRSNQLTGPISVGLGELTNMEWLGLRGNELTGPIPARLGELIDLQSLWLSDNQLTGCVPAGLRDVASNDLGELDLPDCDEGSPDASDDGGSVASDRAALVALYNPREAQAGSSGRTG